MTNQVVIKPFNPLALRHAKKAAGQRSNALCSLRPICRMDARRPYLQLQPCECGASGIPHGRCGLRGLGGQAQAVRPWTVNDVADMQRMVALGVDSIITDVPDVLVSLLVVTGIGRNSQPWITD